ncbi:helicase C-terminal domain-containing protein [Candidatus Poriferisodalis sp.]|uniref:helicase C-terminal domain-containing protein n=1 Tax=Candidatus Poriferisodalis sp. TaxID=3101277 RepID=UPI003B01A351
MNTAGLPIVDVEAELGELREFQRDTAEYAFRRMFVDDDYTTRFLVADEVGLGKTYVAKGVIVQVLNHLHNIGDERHDIVYICSNAAIARQNIRKLVPDSVAAAKPVDRLSMLLHPKHQPKSGKDASRVNLVALTPATSFKMGHRGGRFEERVLAFVLLSSIWGNESLRTAPARRVFWYGIKNGDRKLRACAAEVEQDFRSRAARLGVGHFVEQIRVTNQRRKDEDKPSLKVAFNRLIKLMPARRDTKLSPEAWEARADFIRDIRHTMARTGISLLNPDLVVLDEFQRFKDLLEPDEDHRSEATEHAHSFFNHKDEKKGRKDQSVRCLLLSATPYKAYSGPDDADDHYFDFIRTCKFLFDDPHETEAVKDLFTQLRRSLRELGRTVAGASVAEADAQVASALVDARGLCKKLSDRLGRVMSRTERLAATADRAGMLAQPETHAEMHLADVQAYLQFAELATSEAIQHHDPVEYWKSSPYPLNFMSTEYKLKRDLSEKSARGELPPVDTEGPGLLRWSDVDGYERIDPRNGRLRWLVDDLERRRAFDLLWIPPSLPYYRADTPYEAEAAPMIGTESASDAEGQGGLTKRLIFSGWRMVPRAVSSLVSHEAERRAVGARENLPSGDAATRARYTSDWRGGRNLTLTMVRSNRSGGTVRASGPRLQVKPAGMTSLLFMWPSPALATLGNPRRFESTMAGLDRSLDELRAEVAARIADAFRPLLWQREQAVLNDQLNLNERRRVKQRRADPRWYWAAPVLLDWLMSPYDFAVWFWSCSHDFGNQRRTEDSDELNALTKHAGWAWDLAVNELKVHRWGRMAEREFANPADITEGALFNDGVEPVRLEARLAPPSDEVHPPLGELPSDLLHVLTEVAIGGPGVCSLRALGAVMGRAVDDPVTLGAAAHVGGAFRHFFNTPEASALVELSGIRHAERVSKPTAPFWQKVVGHCVGGNLQALLDEHVHLLRDWRGHGPQPSGPPSSGTQWASSALGWTGHSGAGGDFGWGGVLCRTCARRPGSGEPASNGSNHDTTCPNTAVCDTAATLAEALSLRTASVNVDVPVRHENGTVDFTYASESSGHGESRSRRKMRHRFAVAYGTHLTDQGDQVRAEHVSTAFNSPFWPFVLTSTSVGQEGLDFHLWCHAVVHWNLPTNPVDLEQREGRVHRYKNHAVRRNLAADLGGLALRETLPIRDLWEKLFELGRDEGNEMVPCWAYPGIAPAEEPGDMATVARIERLVPLLPFSREVGQLALLRKKLGAYRLAIGQPRQEELLEYLSVSGALDREDLQAQLAGVRIDLTPPPREKKTS